MMREDNTEIDSRIGKILDVLMSLYVLFIKIGFGICFVLMAIFIAIRVWAIEEGNRKLFWQTVEYNDYLTIVTTIMLVSTAVTVVLLDWLAKRG
jgi:hypothetical protein